MQEQSHLNYIDTVNYGSYYTPSYLVDIVYNMIAKHIVNWKNFKILDTSCGYGNFLRFSHCFGADFDKTALLKAHEFMPECRFFCHNSLLNVSRSQYDLSESENLIIVGNPPYNDTTSIIRNEIKTEICSIDKDLKHRDMGVSFLLSYDKLKADYICVLHPLSYLIKKANFDSLGSFKNNYLLIDSVVISSAEFEATSKSTHFPIIIALYKRDNKGMSYDFIQKHKFKTKEGRAFCLGQFDKLSNYITKYPNHKNLSLNNSIAFFWTMRDINALKRTKTFIQNEVYNSIRVPANKFSFYCYADVFKEYIPHIPYYFGNSDIMINIDSFKNIERSFVRKSLSKYSFLKHLLPENDILTENDNLVIESYFKTLLGEHYVDKKFG
ncbi:MAG: SAM-dependent methyltransferase [bacterium]|nr:SAM-dependent methyltransferase [bacterium]MDY2830116.1 SAM-dependent methyltransferase [Alphaproteobacteria bacterium]